MPCDTYLKASTDRFHISLLAAAALASFQVRQPASGLSVSVIRFHVVPGLPFFLRSSGTDVSTMLLLFSLPWRSTCPMNFHLLPFTSLLSVLMPVLCSRLHCAYSVLPLYFLYAPQAVVEHVNGAITSLTHLPGVASIHTSTRG